METEMNVVLTHPVYGAKIATNANEIEADEKNGWTRYNADTPVEVAPADLAPTKRKYTRKVTEQPVEQPNEVPSFLTSASDESEGT
jgi:hypothetical protein